MQIIKAIHAMLGLAINTIAAAVIVVCVHVGVAAAKVEERTRWGTRI